MDAKKLFDDLLEMQETMQRHLVQLEEMKAELSDLIEKNANLEVENHYLREHLEEISGNQTHEEHANRLTESKATLERLYEDGFHVCNEYFGKHREDGEPCVFCTTVIYGERQ